MSVRQLAFILGLIMCPVVNADEITADTAHEGMLRPADAQFTNYTFWQPEIDGLARYRLHLPPRGIEDANKCIALKPDWPKGYSRLGAAHYLAGQLNEAAKAYAKGLGIDPTNEVRSHSSILPHSKVCGHSLSY